MFDFKTIINNLINIVVWPVFIGLVIAMVIWAGILYVTARGEPGKISKANSALMWAVIGVIVGVLAFSAEGIIKTLLGL